MHACFYALLIFVLAQGFISLRDLSSCCFALTKLVDRCSLVCSFVVGSLVHCWIGSMHLVEHVLLMTDQIVRLILSTACPRIRWGLTPSNRRLHRMLLTPTFVGPERSGPPTVQALQKNSGSVLNFEPLKPLHAATDLHRDLPRLRDPGLSTSEAH